LLGLAWLLSGADSRADGQAQPNEKQIITTILEKDKLFWSAYNRCDLENIGKYLAVDLEFYHDKGGITFGAKNLVASLKKNICDKPDYKLRREAVPDTVHVFPLSKEGAIYGAIITGEHLFFITLGKKKEYQDGHAKFCHLWLLKDNEWRMARVFSYDHQPPRYVNQRKTAAVSDEALQKLAGEYVGNKSGMFQVEKGAGVLFLLNNGRRYRLHPESETLFFLQERDLTFEFSKNGAGMVSKIIICENGKEVEEVERKK